MGSTGSATGVMGDVGDEWLTATRELLTEQVGLTRAATLIDTYRQLLPAGYDELNWPSTAAVDLVAVDDLRHTGVDLTTEMLQFADAPQGEWRFRVYHRNDKVPLADILPLLDHLGFRALDERAFVFVFGGTEAVWLHDIGVSVSEPALLTVAVRAEVQRTFAAEFAGAVEVDGLNRLVLLGGLSAREVEVLRAYSRYLRQIGFPFGRQYIEATLCRHSSISRLLVDLFAQRFDPSHQDSSAGLDDASHQAIAAALDAVPSLDDDRTLRAILTLIEATVRTNAFRPGPDGVGHRPVLAFKFDCSKVPDLPLPRPMAEIWVCSPRLEAVHLRNGMIARGGIRWSDRREDFRTEVLGLVKAQIVKNAVIVPTGAKGGFVLKRAPSDPVALRAEGVACYREFISGLLDLTDNIVGGVVVPPPNTVRHDGDDPYLVVAADKGTASFSDIANEISATYGYWLDDAFASGGSAGYDHKEMGITARGAWESVRRHARAIGKDVERDQLTVVGIGDMSGDVFGNGLLRSPQVKLVAAFDHRHIFIDPDPDPAVSFAERRRLYSLTRSSWADYDSALLSAGGAIYPRTVKSIEISAEARRRLGADRTRFTPVELISAILTAPVDLLWNGGIGTYVKATSETNADVGDRANDALRVDGAALRCRIVGEGGNLGFTQRGRVEYALNGGLINTDAIDNSAGVDCSDHEVNIKILLGSVVASGDMTTEQRNSLLAEMTDEVGELVLDDNRAQTLALAIARRQSLAMVNVYARYLNVLETEGWLNRNLEFLPTDKQVAERQAAGVGFTTPEFAVLMAYTKTTNVHEMVRSDFPDNPYLQPELVSYFPPELQRRYLPEIGTHRLRREIIATQVANQMVNLSGISFDNRMTEDTGAGVVDVMRAWVAARDIFGFVAEWEEIEALASSGDVTRGSSIKLDVQLELFLELRRMIERGTLWLLRHRRPPIDIAVVVAEFRIPMAQLAVALESFIGGRTREMMFASEAGRLAAGVPERLAQRSTLWPLLHTGFDVVELARIQGVAVTAVAEAYWSVFELLDIGWLWDAIGSLPRADRWQTQARSALRDDLLVALADLADDALYIGSASEWAGVNDKVVARTMAMFTEIRRADTYDITTLSVALRQLRNLALVTQRPHAG
ncbi:MAG: NAD-glutamate dehydrogenase domain-containing protein [Ilumatobacteraceae bacterium]